MLLKRGFKIQKSLLPRLHVPNLIKVSFAGNERVLMYIPSLLVKCFSMITYSLTFDMTNSSGIQSCEIIVWGLSFDINKDIQESYQ